MYYSEWLDGILRLSRNLFLQRAGMLVMLLSAVTVIIWLFVNFKVADPLGALLMREYAAIKGDPSEQELPGPNHEISAVCLMFNYMLRKIEEREEEFKSQEQPKSFASAMAGIKDNVSGVLDAARWIRDHGNTLSGKSARLMDSLIRRELALLDLASRLERELEAMLSYHMEQPMPEKDGRQE